MKYTDIYFIKSTTFIKILYLVYTSRNVIKILLPILNKIRKGCDRKVKSQ